MEKKEFRCQMRKIRSLVEQRERKSQIIQRKMLEYIRENRFNRIFVYVSYKDEVRTHELIQMLFKLGYSVAVPKVRGQEMDFLEVKAWTELKSGAYGILEPDNGNKCIPTSQSLMILPGLAFDRTGGRMGYGGGFYDRYLAVHGCARRIAIAYEAQVMERILLEQNDQRVDGVMTEVNFYEFD